jgi:hypothetical protein
MDLTQEVLRWASSSNRAPFVPCLTASQNVNQKKQAPEKFGVDRRFSKATAFLPTLLGLFLITLSSTMLDEGSGIRAVCRLLRGLSGLTCRWARSVAFCSVLSVPVPSSLRYLTRVEPLGRYAPTGQWPRACLCRRSSSGLSPPPHIPPPILPPPPTSSSPLPPLRAHRCCLLRKHQSHREGRTQ